MQLFPLKASLVALALFMTANSGFAAGQSEPGAMVVAQAEDDGGSDSQRVEALRKFLQGGKNLSRLDDDRLQKRLKRAQRFQRVSNLPADLAQELEQEIAALNEELSRRQSGASASSDSQDEPGNNPTQNTQSDDQDPEEPATQGNSSAQGSDEVGTFLQSVRPAAQLDQKQLRAQMRKAVQLSKSDGIAKNDRQQLREVVREARAEMARRKGGNSSADSTDADDGNGQQVQQQDGNNQQTTSNTQQGTGNNQNGDDPQLSGGEAEQRARAILNSNVDARTLSKVELRKRLSNMRELLGSGKLSPETNKELRARLAQERSILRAEVSKDTGSGQNNDNTNNQNGNVDGNNNTVSNTNITVNNTTNITNKEVIKVVVADRRPSNNLRDDELRRRINVYRDVIVDTRYPEAERQQLRIILERDRVTLRQRLLEARRKREAQLRAGVKSGSIDVDIDVNVDSSGRRPPRSVFAAEAEDAEIEQTLAAPARRKIERRYTVEEVESNPQLRDAVARIEIDTVHFGFGEGFLREEEVENLDRIAEIIEKILAANPGEIFMIEGHTDAVGSDAANLTLSRERASAVKEALSTYYVIPEENLETVGFGERYLKIPTTEAEAENRRVSIARITPLVGALDN